MGLCGEGERGREGENEMVAVKLASKHVRLRSEKS